MATQLPESAKLSIAYKKLIGREHRDSSKQWYEEYATATLTSYKNEVWVNAIPSTPPGATTSVIKVYTTAGDGDITMCADGTVASNKGWRAWDGSAKRDFIPPKFGSGYTVKVYEDDGGGSKAGEVFTTNTAWWTFDYETGYLSFNDDPTTQGLTTPFHIEAYQYIGAKLDEYMEWTALSTNPATPPANTIRVYALQTANVTKLMYIDSAGTTTQVGAGGAGNAIYIEEGANPEWDTTGADGYLNFNTSAFTLTTNGQSSTVSLAAIISASAISLSGNFSTSGTLHVSGSVTFGDTLSVSGTATFGGAVTISSTLTVTGDTTVSGDVNIGTNLCAAGTLEVIGATTLDGATTINDTLLVSGTSTFQGATTISGGLTVNTLAVTGNATVCGTLTVDGNTTIDANLIVSGTSTLQGAVTISGGLTVSGAITLDGTTINDGLVVSGTTSLGGNTTISGTLTVSGATTIDGITKINNVLNVSGNTTFDGTIITYNTVTMNNALRISGALTVCGTTSLAVTVICGGLTVNTVAITSTLTVCGTTTLGGSTLINNTLAVSGAATFHSTLSVTGAVTLGSTLIVCGETSLHNNVIICGALTICGSATLNGTALGTGGGGATVALDNLDTVAINTSLVSDTSNTDDLGSNTIFWKTAYVNEIIPSSSLTINFNAGGYHLQGSSSAPSTVWVLCNLRPSADNTFSLGAPTAVFTSMHAYGIESYDNMSIGSIARLTSAKTLYVEDNSTNAASNISGFYCAQTRTPASNVTYITTGMEGFVGLGNTNFNGATVYGLQFGAWVAPSTTGGHANLTSYGAYIFPAGTFNGTFNLGTGYGVFIDPFYVGGVLNATNLYGLRVGAGGSIGAGSVTTSYQVSIAKPTIATTNYQLVLDGNSTGSGIWFNGISSYSRIFASAANDLSLAVGATTRISMNATGIGFFAATPVAKPTVTGSRGGNAALASVLTALANLGLITNSSTA